MLTQHVVGVELDGVASGRSGGGLASTAWWVGGIHTCADQLRRLVGTFLQSPAKQLPVTEAEAPDGFMTMRPRPINNAKACE